MLADPRAFAQLANPLVAGPSGAPSTLLLHGLGGDQRQLWGSTAAPQFGLPRTIAADARLHGRSVIHAYSLEFLELAADQWALLDYLKVVGPVLLVGVSMGAATCLQMWSQRPDRVAGMVLIRPAWAAAGSPPNLDVLVEIGELLELMGEVDGRHAFLSSDSYLRLKEESPSAATSALDQFSKPLARARSRRLREIPKSAPIDKAGDLSSVDIPVAILPMPGDPLHPLAIAEELARLIPNAELEELPCRDRFPAAHGLTLDAEIARIASKAGVLGR